MKVFISWSGARSKELAFALREWLPLVLQYVEPWVSEKDISAGDRWAQAIAGELETSNFGIICITPENLNSQWVLFEAGALSKSMLDAKVIPLLFGLELSDLGGPLAQFQAQKADENGLMEIVKAINKVSDKKAADGIITQLVPTLWPMLSSKMDAIPDKTSSDKHMRPQHEILEELVTGVRGLNSRMRDFDPEMLMMREERNFDGRFREIHPKMIEEMLYFPSEGREMPEIALLILSGIIRDQIPWLSEILVEAYRDAKHAGPEELQEISHRLQSAVRYTTRGPFGSMLMRRSKSGEILLMELPRLISRIMLSLFEPHRPDEPEKPSKADE